MKRVVVAAIVVAAVGFVGFNAPARGADGHGAVMVTVPTGFKFAKGICGTSSGDGVFTIPVGDSITWKNCTGTDHTVTGEGFGSTDHIAPESSVTITFDSPGSFPYHCNIHASMTGAVNVTGEPTTMQTLPPTTVATTAKPTTTTVTTAAPATTTTADLSGVFGGGPTSSTTSTTVDSTVTTRALGTGGDSGTSAGAVGLLVLGLGAVGTAGALIIRRMRASGAPPS